MRGARLGGTRCTPGTGPEIPNIWEGKCAWKAQPVCREGGCAERGEEKREENPREGRWGNSFIPSGQLRRDPRWKGGAGSFGVGSQGTEFPGNQCEGSGSQDHLLLFWSISGQQLQGFQGLEGFSGKAGSSQLGDKEFQPPQLLEVSRIWDILSLEEEPSCGCQWCPGNAEGPSLQEMALSGAVLGYNI